MSDTPPHQGLDTLSAVTVSPEMSSVLVSRGVPPNPPATESPPSADGSPAATPAASGFVTDERLYRWIFGSAAQAIVAVDPALNVMGWNRAAEEVFGLVASEILGQSVSALTEPRQWPRLRRLLKRTLRDQVVTAFEDRRPGPYGGTLHLAVMLAPILDDDGACVGVSGLVRDISHRIQLRDDLIRAERLAGLGQLAGGVAHNFNNLLSAMTMRIDMALSSREPRQMDRALRSAADAATRMSEIVSNLLLFARPHHISHEATQLEDLVREFAALRESRLAAGGITLETHLQPAGPVMVNREHLTRVLDHFVTNASEAIASTGRPGGRIRLRTWCEQPTLRDAGEPDNAPRIDGPATDSPGDKLTENTPAVAKFECADNGPGITPGVIGHIFEPFFTTKSAYSGASGNHVGLGLTVAYALVTEMGGRIHAAGYPGQGAIMTVTLPLAGPDDLQSGEISSESIAAYQMPTRGR